MQRCCVGAVAARAARGEKARQDRRGRCGRPSGSAAPRRARPRAFRETPRAAGRQLPPAAAFAAGCGSLREARIRQDLLDRLRGRRELIGEEQTSRRARPAPRPRDKDRKRHLPMGPTAPHVGSRSRSSGRPRRLTNWQRDMLVPSSRRAEERRGRETERAMDPHTANGRRTAARPQLSAATAPSCSSA